MRCAGTVRSRTPLYSIPGMHPSRRSARSMLLRGNYHVKRKWARVAAGFVFPVLWVIGAILATRRYR